MAGYRFQVTMSMCFTVNENNDFEAEKLAREFVDSFRNGVSVGPNVGPFSDADAQVYSNDPELELVDVDTDYKYDEQA